MWPEGTEGYNEFAEAFPYGRNETDLESARQVLEEAGITQDDPYDLELTTYESQTFQEFGRVTRDKLSGTGLNLSLNRTKFNSLIDRGKSGELAFYSLGWAWSWVSPAYGLFGFEPENTDTGTNFNGYYLDWQEYLEE
jgi:peptide/nickel transport system substrate-binding protein